MPIYASHIRMPHLPHFGHAKKSVLQGMEFVDHIFAPAEKTDKGSKRRSLDGSSSFKGRSRSPSPAARRSTPTTMKIRIESPPLVSYGPPRESTGALLSGQLCLTIKKEQQEFEKLTLKLLADVVTKHPVTAGCHDCTVTTTELHQWNLVSDRTVLCKDEHLFPFSYLFPGHLPASNDNALSKLSYRLSAVGTATDGEEIHLTDDRGHPADYPLVLSRSILPGPDRHSIRIFPPTSLSASVTLPSVVHPGGTFQFDVRVDGVVNAARQTRWRMRKAAWRIEENARSVSPACEHHARKLGGDGKGILHEEVRTVGSGELKGRWKSDFSTADGKVEMEMEAATSLDAACDVDAPCGINVAHTLVVEMIVAEEYAPKTGEQRMVTPTGAARVLRMQFQLRVTERPGLGISWDEEAPPMYDDVPASPPSYGNLVSVEEIPLPPDYDLSESAHASDTES